MKLTSLALVAALSLASGASFAQPAPQAAPGPHAGHQHAMSHDPAQMAERHAQHLRDALQLRPDQEPALRALVASMPPMAGDMDHMRKDRDEDAKLTTPQRLDRMQARMAEHQQHFQAHVAAVKRFYAQLTPAQQKAFDAMPMMGMHHDGGMGHGMGGGAGMKHGPHGGPGAPGGHDHGGPPPAGI